MSHLLPRFTAAMQAIEDAEKIGRILRDTGTVEQMTTAQRATLPGDTRRLRGIPCIARGVAGVSPGTDPRGVVRRLI